jgi:hypothetical protein
MLHKALSLAKRCWQAGSLQLQPLALTMGRLMAAKWVEAQSFR